MINSNIVNEIINIFKKTYPDPVCTLDYTKPHELLFSTQLAAQCTDKRVNIVGKTLYKKYLTIEDFANADINELEEDIKSTGFYKNKAKNIISCAKKLLNDYNSQIPNNMKDLLTLPGVGRKTANVVLGELYNIPSIIVDTHATRLSKRIGFTKNTDPYKIELDLLKIIPQEEQTLFCHRLVAHGREICIARNPKCNLCPINKLCKKNI